jgi:hypothetical protein
MKFKFADPDNMPVTGELFLCSRGRDAKIVSEEIKLWLFSLLKLKTFTEEVQEKIIGHISTMLDLKKSMGLYAGSWFWLEEFKPLFLFNNHNPESLNCFDEAKLEAERLAVIPGLFREAHRHANAKVFWHHVELVIPEIKKYAEENKKFQEAYKKKLNEVRAASTIDERVFDYLSMGYTYYTPQLIAELEDIDIALIDKKHLLYLIYGKSTYKTIVSILNGKFDKKTIPKIADLPVNTSSYQIFISLAAKRNNISLLERLFEDLSSDKIIKIFFRYFDDKISKNEWLLDNARAEFPELLSIYRMNDIETLSSTEEDFQLFTGCFTEIFENASEGEWQTLFQEENLYEDLYKRLLCRLKKQF